MANKAVIVRLDPDQLSELKAYAIDALDKAEKERDALAEKLKIAVDALNEIMGHSTETKTYDIACAAMEKIEPDEEEKGIDHA